MELDCHDSSLNPVFQFKQIKTPSNKLINKKLNVIEVDDKLDIVECKDTQSEPTVTRAEHSLCLENSASYFEVEIMKTTEDDAINVGLISKDCNNKQFLGKSINSFGYLKGAVYLDKRKVSNSTPLEKLKEGDRIGLGINCHKRTFFVVKNGLVVLKGVDIPYNWNEYIPAVSLTNESQKVRFHFNSQAFQFKLSDYCNSIETQLQAQIENTSTFTNNQIYSLVHEYLSFNKYSETLSLLNQKKIDFHKLSRYTKNPSIANPAIDLEKKNQKVMVGEDQQMNEPLKVRGRIMSQKLNENDQSEIEIRRKNTEMVAEEEHVRKFSIISNLSNISNKSNVPLSNLSQQKQECLQELQQQIEQKINENQRFLDKQRYQIVELIKDRKIEEAIELMQSRIPNIFDDNYILAFMKAHVFLQKVRQQSNKEAIAYSKQQKTLLRAHFSTLCPFYNSLTNQTEWKPLSTIFLALAYNTQTQCKLPQNCCDMISEEQFFTFAAFINKLILNKMGYLACSRLAYFTSHMRKIQEKLKELRGMNCGIEFKG